MSRTAAQKRSRSGLNALKARIKVRGLSAIDMRTSAARALLEWRNELLTDLGGERNLSAQKRALVEMASRTRLYVDHIDGFIMESGVLVNKRRKSLLPIVQQREVLVGSLARLLAQLGLERQARPVQSLSAYIADHDRREKEPA